MKIMRQHAIYYTLNSMREFMVAKLVDRSWSEENIDVLGFFFFFMHIEIRRKSLFDFYFILFLHSDGRFYVQHQ